MTGQTALEQLYAPEISRIVGNGQLRDRMRAANVGSVAFNAAWAEHYEPAFRHRIMTTPELMTEPPLPDEVVTVALQRTQASVIQELQEARGGRQA